MSDQALDVLAYIDFVWELQWREVHRADPAIDWQPDMTWSEMLACTGWEGRCLLRTLTIRPGESTGDATLDAQLYWPRVPAADVGRRGR